MARRDIDDDDDGGKGGRTGRIRKKSAKVREMEEFEEIEKKQFTKKSDPKGKAGLTPPAMAGKKVKGKGVEGGTPRAPAVQADSLSPGLVLPAPSVAQESLVTLSPVKASTKQAIGAKVREGQGSVIKLLLSSPTIPTTPSISTNVITKTSPPVSVSSSAVSITSALAPTTKKGTVKIKTELKQEVGRMVSDEELAEGLPIKSELLDSRAAGLMLAASLSPSAISPPPGVLSAPQVVLKTEPSTVSVPQVVFKAEPSSVSAEGLGSLKLKLMMSPKDTTTILDPAVPVASGAIHSMLMGNTETVLESMPSTAVATTATKKKPAPRKRKLAGEKPKKQAASKSAAEQMPNLAALVSTPKLQKVSKEEVNVSMSDGMDTSLSDTSLDMSSIVESALDMEEEAALVIAEGAPAPSKPKKKRAGGGGKKKAKAQAAAMDMDSDDGMSAPPEGDIAALAAKVQRSSGGMGGKKKALKKSQELQESLQDKKKRPSRRAPTAYMLYCNSQRPKVVAESPGIDFAQISRTLGVMWQCLSKKEKMMWRRKSKKMAGKGSTLISTGKGTKRIHASAAAAAAASMSMPVVKPSGSSKSKPSAAAISPALAGDDTPQSPVKGFGIEPIDIAAHLKLLGESLSIIGNRLQEHKGLIAVQGSLSVLLDSMLCACGPLLALTHQVPGLDGCSEATHARTLDSVAYIMPGL